MAHLSPLRYPGGKNRIYNEILKIINENSLNDKTYVEPYAGGAGLALRLLANKDVRKIIINDFDRSIYAFWYSVLNYSNELIEKIKNVNVTLEEREKQKEVQKNKNVVDLLTLGFSTFYLNRTNRSGIITGGPIGGYKQEGDYLIDCRFNKEALIEKIKKIAKLKDKIELYNLDALNLIKNIKNRKIFMYLDPPYYEKGQVLYLNFYEEEDHINIAKLLKKVKFPYIVSYDNVKQITDLYVDNEIIEFNISHQVSNKGRMNGKEVLIFSNNLIKPYNLFDNKNFI